jgi:hypothetical protein
MGCSPGLHNYRKLCNDLGRIDIFSLFPLVFGL